MWRTLWAFRSILLSEKIHPKDIRHGFSAQTNHQAFSFDIITASLSVPPHAWHLQSPCIVTTFRRSVCSVCCVLDRSWHQLSEMSWHCISIRFMYLCRYLEHTQNLCQCMSLLMIKNMYIYSIFLYSIHIYTIFDIHLPRLLPSTCHGRLFVDEPWLQGASGSHQSLPICDRIAQLKKKHNFMHFVTYVNHMCDILMKRILKCSSRHEFDLRIQSKRNLP